MARKMPGIIPFEMQKNAQLSRTSSAFERLVHLAAVCFTGFALLYVPCVADAGAIMVKNGISLYGYNLLVDSYNSSDPSKSTNGQYDPTKAGDAGDVICGSGFTNIGSANSVNIFGRLYYSGGSADLGSNGAVGTHAWQSNNTGFEPGYLVQNTNFPFTNISLPDYSPFLGPTIPGGIVAFTDPTTGNTCTNYYDHIIAADYYCTDPGALTGQTLVAYPSILVMVNGFTLSGQDNITIESGASLMLYSGGTNCALLGQGVSMETPVPANFRVYCTTSVTNLDLGGSGTITGVFDAPGAQVQVLGGGANPTNFCGAIIADSFALIGHISFHFDEALLQQGIIPPSPSMAANLTSPTMLSTGQFQFNVSGVVGFNSVVEASTDLTDWSPIFTNSLPFTFTDTNGSGLDQNFYRVVTSFP